MPVIERQRCTELAHLNVINLSGNRQFYWVVSECVENSEWKLLSGTVLVKQADERIWPRRVTTSYSSRHAPMQNFQFIQIDGHKLLYTMWSWPAQMFRQCFVFGELSVCYHKDHHRSKLATCGYFALFFVVFGERLNSTKVDVVKNSQLKKSEHTCCGSMEGE